MTTHKEIVKATAENIQMVGRTEFHDPGTKQQYVLEYPIKTMNFQPKDDSFQVDTGSLLVPDFQSKSSRTIERLEMAHIAYNRLDRAEFILRRPTPVTDKEGTELCKVLHYSEIQETPARTIMLAGEDR
jgi:hypothetical protein